MFEKIIKYLQVLVYFGVIIYGAFLIDQIKDLLRHEEELTYEVKSMISSKLFNIWLCFLVLFVNGIRYAYNRLKQIKEVE